MKRGCRLFRQYKPDPLSAITFLHLQNAADRPRGLKLQLHQLLTFNTFMEVAFWFGTERIIYFWWNQLQSTGLIALLKIHSWLHCILVRFLLRWVPAVCVCCHSNPLSGQRWIKLIISSFMIVDTSNWRRSDVGKLHCDTLGFTNQIHLSHANNLSISLS